MLSRISSELGIQSSGPGELSDEPSWEEREEEVRKTLSAPPELSLLTRLGEETATEGSLLTKLGEESSGVTSISWSSELVETRVRPELLDNEPEPSDGEDTPERKDDTSSRFGGGYRGLNVSRSSSNSRMIKLLVDCLLPLPGASPFPARFAGAVICGRCAATQQVQKRRLCMSHDISSSRAV